MRRLLPLLLVLLFALTACSPAQPDAAAPDAPAAEETTQSTAPVIHDVTDAETPSEDDFPPEAESKAGEATPAEADDAPNEGDIDSGTLAQIDALEQDSSVRNDDVAPVEASAYCKLSVSCEALLERQDALVDILLPPDGIFYSGTIVLKGGETALSLISNTLAACGLICDITDGSIHQIASIPQNLQSDMQWVVRCNGEVLDDPASFAVNSGDELVLSYE